MDPQCGFYKSEDGKCLIDEGVCEHESCSHGLFRDDDPEYDQDDPWGQGTCVFEYDSVNDIASFSCTLPEWI